MIRAIKTAADYEAALARVEEIFGSEPGSPESDELEVWGALISAYEDENHPVLPPTPLEAIKFVMDQKGLKQKDLIAFIGTKSKVSEVLAGKRKLNLDSPRNQQNSEMGVRNICNNPIVFLPAARRGRHYAAKRGARRLPRSKAMLVFAA